MSQQTLNSEEIHPILQQVGGKAAAQSMDGGFLLNSRLPMGLCKCILDDPLAKTPASIRIEKQPTLRVPGTICPPIFSQDVQIHPG